MPPATHFNGFTPATDATPASNLGTYYGIEDRISDYLDQPAPVTSKSKAGYDFLAHSSENTKTVPPARSNGVNLANASDSIYVQAGLFQDNVTINKALSLYGAYAGTSVPPPRAIAPPARPPRR